MIAKRPKRKAQIVLGPGPILRLIGLGPDFEGGAISGHRVLEQFASFFSGAARPEVSKRVALIFRFVRAPLFGEESIKRTWRSMDFDSF
jgi:hypothetical protein